MKLLFGLLALVALAMGGWVLFSRFSQDKVEPTPVVSVTKGDVEVAVEASGEIQPVQQVEVKTEVSGKIKQLLVQVGQPVTQGQEIARIDDTELLTERAGSATEVEGAKVELQQTENEFRRAQELMAKKLISIEAFEEAKTARDLKQTVFDRTKRKLQQVDDRLAKTRIIAPMAGQVLSLPVVEGQVVIAAASVNAGTTIMTIGDLSQLLIEAHINQVDIVSLQPSHPVSIKVDSLPGVVMTGVVTQIAPLASTKNNIKGFEVEILVKEFDPRVRPGMSSDLRFLVGQAQGVLTVPVTSVFGSKDGERYVWVPSGKKFVKQVVEVGLSNFELAEILRGLSEGQSIARSKPKEQKPKPRS